MIIRDRDFIKQSKMKVVEAFSDKKIAEMYEKCMENTLNTTIRFDENGTFILTGDIPAMWLRDSVCQIRPFLLFAKDHKEIQEMLVGLVKRQMQLIKIDPYANAFNQEANSHGHQDDKTKMGPIIWERKYEIDSLCYPIQLSYLLWKIANRTEQFNVEFLEAVKEIISLWKMEQHHEEMSEYLFERDTDVLTDTLVRKGKGAETRYTGLTWSGFRPSDDACTYGYLVPSNMFAVVALGYLEEIIAEFYDEVELLDNIKKLKEEIQQGIQEFAITEHTEFGEIYAYEVDGYGNQLLMDDANVPSLISLPLLNYCKKDDPVYLNTREFILSSSNPFFFKGKEANGVGSPHTPHNYVWPIALSVQGLTSNYEAEKREIINTLVRTDAGKGLMHESFNVDNSQEYTREWFSWANMMFCELVLDVAGVKLENVIDNGTALCHQK